MDSQDKAGNQFLPFSGVAFALLAIGVVLFSDAPFKPTRPPMPDRVESSTENVRARMWQDPFAAVERHQKEHHAYQMDSPEIRYLPKGKTHGFSLDKDLPHKVCNPSDTRKGGFSQPDSFYAHSIEELRCQIQLLQEENKIAVSANKFEVQTLAVLVPGGPYAEDGERRTRNRYAIVTALARAGYVPEDAEHIGYFEFASACRHALRQKKAKGSKWCDWPPYVPYEWFEPLEDIKKVSNRLEQAVISESSSTSENLTDQSTGEMGDSSTVQPGRILILWLDDDEMARDGMPLNMLYRLRNGITPGKISKNATREQTGVGFDILGPASSGTLRMMYEEVNVPKKDNEISIIQTDSRIFSWQATVSTNNILSSIAATGSDKSQWLQDHLIRTISNDGNLARELMCELTRRGVNPYCVYGDDDCFKDLINHCPGAVKSRREGPLAPLLNAISDSKSRNCQKTDSCDDPRGYRDHVVLINESDTFYARALNIAIESEVQSVKDVISYGDGGTPNWVHSFSYLRGIDGVKANDAVGKTKKAGNTDKPMLSKNIQNEQIRRAAGPNQFDYLRRLAAAVATLDEKLRREGSGEVRAIGILGNDNYDKLLVLQALRDRFLGILFFSTDLDARMLHPAESEWTRNLIVASGFGLELDPLLQGSTPPFRDNYQTALYFSTLAVLGVIKGGSGKPDDIGCVASLKPRLFEIGNNRVVDITPCAPFECDLETVSGKKITFIHPKRKLPPLAQIQIKQVLPVFMGLSAAVIFLLLAGPGARRVTGYMLPALILLIVIVLCLKGYLFSDGFYGEPFTLNDGVSIWPSIFLRAVAAVFAFLFIIHALLRLKKNSREIVERYGLSDNSEQRHTWKHWRYLNEHGINCPSGKHGIAKYLEFLLIDLWDYPLGKTIEKRLSVTKKEDEQVGQSVSEELAEGEASHPSENETIEVGPKEKNIRQDESELVVVDEEVQEKRSSETEVEKRKMMRVSLECLWGRYIELGSAPRWLPRVVMMFLLYFILLASLTHYSGPPNIPFRGLVSYQMGLGITIVSVILYLFLILLVMDVTRLHDRMMYLLNVCDIEWPENVLRKCCDKLGLTERVAKEKLRMELIVQRATAVDPLLFYPFLILTIMIVSRSRYFDDWDFPKQLIIAIGLSAVIALSNAVRLRRTAQKSRKSTLNKLQGYLFQALASEARAEQEKKVDVEVDETVRQLSNDQSNTSGACRAYPLESERIRMLIKEVENIDAGPFVPLARHPIIRAVAMPFGGVGGLYLIDYLTAVSW